jgi:hypothetical protein
VSQSSLLTRMLENNVCCLYIVIVLIRVKKLILRKSVTVIWMSGLYTRSWWKTELLHMGKTYQTLRICFIFSKNF